jgi:hypothetical protein
MSYASLNFPRVFARVTDELKRAFRLDGQTAQGYCLLAIRRHADINNDRLVELQAPVDALDGWRPRDYGNLEDAAAAGFRAFSAAAWRFPRGIDSPQPRRSDGYHGRELQVCRLHSQLA